MAGQAVGQVAVRSAPKLKHAMSGAVMAPRSANSDKSAAPQLSDLAFLWPAFAAASAGGFAFLAKEFANFWDLQPGVREPSWTTRNKVALELSSGRLRDFSTRSDGIATLVCAPFALHGATITDLAPGHSLVATLLGAGLQRVFVTDWRSATPAMRHFSIDTYLADLNIMVDQLGGNADLVGLCQGGCLALIYAARFPKKVRKLVLAGAPIDIAAGDSVLSRRAKDTPLVVFKDLVARGDGRVLGRHLLHCWNQDMLEPEAIAELLQVSKSVTAPEFRRLEARFLEWHAWTLDLPGTYYLEVVERLFKDNQLAAGQFVALGRRIDLAKLHTPMFLLAARNDEIVAPAQTFATEQLTRSPARELRKAMASTTHLGLFFGRRILADEWMRIARWLRRRERAVKSPA
jgi:poly(3-hydroxyalkanoate) synthetase